ncbi:MAG: hypothetical protein ACYTG6_12695 [Planctomycetota bacterium]|jgi:hypothetical protein
MNRFIAIVLGGAALALFVPHLLEGPLEKVNELWVELIGSYWHERLLEAGGGILAGLALVLLAVRGRD